MFILKSMSSLALPSYLLKVRNIRNTIRLKNNGYPGEDLEKRNSGVIFCGRESILKNKEKSIQENIAFCNTISSGFVKPEEHTDGKMKL